MKRYNYLIPYSPRPDLNPPGRYAIIEAKKALLDSLTIQVLNAEGEVEKFQAIVTALTEKLTKFEGFLADAGANRAHTLSNKNLVDQVVQDAKNLLNNSEIAFDEVVIADGVTKRVAINMREVINKLIFSAEVINKLANLVIRKKALNPLISDELVTLVGTAGKDANNAISLTLTALQATYFSQAVSGEAEAAAALEFTQAKDFVASLTSGKNSLQSLIHKAYVDAKNLFQSLQTAVADVIEELNHATAALNKAEVKLKSIQAKLAAENAAALAS
ncbi:MAG: hypothetical protein KDD99_14300 [Bacteroidetes bacterium]|nr:hypothetical protein [Bacteroidota bacterium]